ncbi:MAG: hypothetical protein JWR83_1798 [Aeromicrobium sp.]|nr:hypothetical protein [Aeromicrobium sp.]
MRDEKATFLERCSDEERPAFEAVIDAMDSLVQQRVDAAAAGGTERPHVTWVLEKVALLLQLRLPQNGGKSAIDIPLLYVWPSTRQTRTALPDSLTVNAKPLEPLPPAAVAQFGRDLEQAGLVPNKSQGWRTSTFQQVEKGRMTRIFVEGKWGPINVTNIVTAVRNLLDAITSADQPHSPSSAQST